MHPKTERKTEAQKQNETLEWNEREEDNEAGITQWARCYRNSNKSITGPCALLRFMKVSTLLLQKTQTSWLATQSPKCMFLFPSRELIGGTHRALIHTRVPEGGSICISKHKLHPCHWFDAICCSACRKPPTSAWSVPSLSHWKGRND